MTHPDFAFISQRHLEQYVEQPRRQLRGTVRVLESLGDSPSVEPRMPWPTRPVLVVVEPVKPKKPSGIRDRRAASKKGWQTRYEKIEAARSRRLALADRIEARQRAKDVKEREKCRATERTRQAEMASQWARRATGRGA